MSDAIDRVSLYTPGDKLSLMSRRQRYADFVAAGKPGTPRTDEKITAPILANRRAQAEADDTARLINPLPPGAVVRTDIGEETKEISDDVRLNLAKALLPKMENADPEMAERMATAAHALLGGITRADDGKEVDPPPNGERGGSQPTPPPKPGSSPLNRRNPAEKGRHATDEDDGSTEGKPRKASDDADGEPTLKEVMDAIRGVTKRMDALEKRDDDEDENVSIDSESSAPQALAADAERVHQEGFKVRKKWDRLNKITMRPDTQDMFSAVQARADRVYSLHGMSADRPLHGEALLDYRRRLLRPFQHMSPAFKHSDLRVLGVDPAGFKSAEDTIYANAEAEGRNPKSVPPGILREHTENRNGHQYTIFYGRPSTWMNQFAGIGKRVKRITERTDNGGPGRTLYERPA